ncbi:hypothetical protein COU74_01260 [Candidatus Peregrinibacteria bacterium CG10_big_fil_rev_8_21_14_0_10_36_19]|nr:MAG: hypothetical protein COU74_01260 [Candidatus Peregrinibacteria bacterium CG10_big_fil_rev_8_21_14_0_10_36_19]
MSEATLFKKWMSFFYVFNDTPENRETISDFLFYEFSTKPDVFYRFAEHIRQKLKNAKASEQKIIANAYLGVLSPICARFGFYGEKDKLDDICFQIAEPANYERIERILKTYKEQSKDIIQKTLLSLKKVLNKTNFDYEIKGRYKNILSVHKKLQNRPRKTVLTLKDIFAFRIVLKKNSVEDCFDVMNLLHDEFYPVVDYFKDYITIPKINGYQSLHTGLTNVVPHLNIPIEVQIRTAAMDEFAEKGIAAHWIYSKTKKAHLISEKEKMLLDYMSSFAQKEVANQVYFFSHDGDVFNLDKGSTVLDFAYFLHTDLGNKMEYAIVNGEKKNLEYKIENGDRIKIVKSNP